MMKNILLYTVLIAAISGCSRVVVKDWQATGGSRADATVKLSYDYRYGETPQLSDQQAINLAQKRCAIWGYSGAEAFGGQTDTCNQRDPYLGCVNGIVTKEFQCTGMGNKENKSVVQE